MESLVRSSRVISKLDLSTGTTGRSSTVGEDVSLEIIPENSISIDFPPSHENGTESLWAESELTVVIIFQMILLIVLCLLGTCINSLVFWVFNRRPALRSLSNRFVLSLVTANLFISSIISPLILLGTVLNHYVAFSCLPEVLSTIANSIVFSAIFSTLLIALDRYYAVTSPLHYSMTITRSRSQIMILIAWFSGLLLSLPHLLICILVPESQIQQNFHIISSAVQLSLGFSFPFLGLCYLYWRMYTAAHRNSERTRKHSISGELLTVMDGSTSVIPQGIDFLTHYMNPFSKTPMAGSAIPTGPPTATGVIVTVKKNRRRSSNGSSSSLLFREEGRAIKTAFFVLGSFLLCWSPHFSLLLVTELRLTPTAHFGRNVQLNYTYGNWDQFFSVSGMLLSSLLHPFIYVFRNKMACKELTKLLCGFLIEKRKQDLIKYSHNNNHQTHNHCTANPRPEFSPDRPLHSPPSILSKSPRRSSMKSLTPQSSLNSNSTHVNLTTHSSNDSSSSTDSPIMLICPEINMKPPFLRSLTLPEQPRVKFPPNLIRQKSFVQRTMSGPGGEIPQNKDPRSMSKYSDSGICETPITSTAQSSRRSTFVRQDSICSILSNDSVLMICADDGLLTSDITFCSNSHQIRNSGVRRQGHNKIREDEIPKNGNTKFIDDPQIPASGNGKYGTASTWNPLSQIPLVGPCLRDSKFRGSNGRVESGVIVLDGSHSGGSRGESRGESRGGGGGDGCNGGGNRGGDKSLEGIQPTFTLSPRSRPSVYDNSPGNLEDTFPSSFAANSPQLFPVLLQTSI